MYKQAKPQRGLRFYAVIVYLAAFAFAQIAFQVLVSALLGMAQAVADGNGDAAMQSDFTRLMLGFVQWGELPMRCILAPFIATIAAFTVPTVFAVFGFVFIFMFGRFIFPSSRRD